SAESGWFTGIGPNFFESVDKMTKHKYEHKRQAIVRQTLSEVRVPYWRRAHRDWRFLVVVVLMLAAIATYVMTGDLSWQNHGHVVPVIAP
ncbi:MAG TPA: hypothetical protein VK791_04115, partial [bacterium]|nr:hypothetical protein [bacterium]